MDYVRVFWDKERSPGSKPLDCISLVNRRKIALATAVRDRPDYLRGMIQAALHTQWSRDAEFSWFFSDDASEEAVCRMLLEHADPLEAVLKGQVHLERNAVPLGCDRNVLQAIYTAIASEPEWVCVVDSDMVMHPRWMTLLLEVVRWAEANEQPLMAVTAFNSRMHQPGRQLIPGVIRKDSVGGACTMIKESLLTELRLHKKVTTGWGSSEPGWDWKLTDAIRERRGLIACLSPSYAQHIGEKGAHSTGAVGFDTALDFVGQDVSCGE